MTLNQIFCGVYYLTVLVYCTLKQGLGKYPPLATSTEIINSQAYSDRCQDTKMSFRNETIRAIFFLLILTSRIRG